MTSTQLTRTSLQSGLCWPPRCPHGRGCKAAGINTAFLNAVLSDSFETVFARPPQPPAGFGRVPPGTMWKVRTAIHGLRIAPKAWGIERDKQLKQMESKVAGKLYVFVQSHICPSGWPILRSSVASEGGLCEETRRQATARGILSRNC